MGLLFGGSDQTTNKTQRNKMVQSFSNEVNKSVVSQISTKQDLKTGDVVISGKGNKVDINQMASISAEQYISQMSKVVSDVQSTLSSQLEAAQQNDKSAGDSMTASGGMTPAGPTASATVGGLVSTASSTTNTTNETESYLKMAAAVNEAIRTGEEIIQSAEIGNIEVSGEGNEFKFGQNAAIDKMIKIIQDSDAEFKAETDQTSVSKSEQTMTASGNQVIGMASVVGVLIPLAIIYMAFGGGGGGGAPVEMRRQQYIQQRCGAQGTPQCRSNSMEKFDEKETNKKFMYGILIFIVIIIVIVVLYKLIKYIKSKF